MPWLVVNKEESHSTLQYARWSSRLISLIEHWSPHHYLADKIFAQGRRSRHVYTFHWFPNVIIEPGSSLALGRGLGLGLVTKTRKRAQRAEWSARIQRDESTGGKIETVCNYSTLLTFD